MKTLPTMARTHLMRLGLLLSLLIGGPVWATPECPIVTARFPVADGTTADNSPTGWYLDASKVSGTGYFAVKSNRMHAQELGGEGIWYSKVFSTTGYTDWQVAVKVSSEGDMNSAEYVKIYYKINGGAEILLSQRTGNFGTIDFISPLLNGSTVQLVVKIYNYNNGGSQTSKYYIEEYRVFKEKGACAGTIPVTATAGNGGVLTCANQSIILSAGSTATNVSYSWTGPNNFTSTSQNPSVNTAGVYTVTGTNSSGSGSATVTVTENKVVPDLSATGGTLACGSNVSLNASSSVSNAQYSWTGPGGYTNTTQNPTVSTAGIYTVTVKNPANGCINSKSVEVKSGTAAVVNTWVEDFTLSNGTSVDNGSTAWSVKTTSGSTFSVSGNEFKVSGIGTSGEGVWTSGSINIAGKTNVSISINTRSAVASGAAMNETGTYLDYIKFYYKLNGGAEVLFAEKKAAVNNHSTSNTTVSVAGLSGSSLQIIVKSRASGSDEFYYFDNVKVTAIDPSATLTTAVSGPVTCVSNAQIMVTPSTTVSSYAWTGPNGFTSTTQNPVVSAGGEYIVTATLSSGCTVSAPVTVAEDKSVPDVTATGGALACMSGITLNASSSVPNVSYSWTGPDNFTSSSKNPTVSATGTYTVTAKDPANGCTASASAQVSGGTSAPAAFWLEDFALANGTTADNGSTAWTLESTGAGTVSVQNNEFKVSYNAAAEAKWSSEVIDISGKSDVVISADLKSETPGSSDLFEDDDYIRVYYKLNGGAEVQVFNDAAGIGSSTSGTARTSITSAALNGSTLQVIIRARNSSNTERYYFDNVKLTGADRATGDGLTATASVADTLTCIRTSVTLSGASNASGVSYSWTGPGGFTSQAQNPAVTTAGDYILTVSNASGCTGKDTVTVIANTTVPTASAGVSGPLSCATSSVTLSASSETANVTYGWTGPNGFTSALQRPVVSVAGTYTLTVTNPANGCKNTATATVTSLGSAIATLWLEDFTLNNGTTVDNGSTAWSTQTPSGSTFAVSSNEFRISGQGINGESVWTSGLIDIIGKTGVGISANARSAVTGGAVMNESGTYADYLRFYYRLNGGSEVLYAERKSDINGHSTTYTYVSVAGLSGNSLQLVIRARATGTDEFYYVDNVKVTGTPTGTLTAIATVNDTLTCARPSVTLSGSSNTSDVTYSWSGPSGFTSNAQNPAVTAPGHYILTVTNSSTACTGKDTVTVIQNNFSPGATAEVSGPLTCVSSTVVLSGNSATTGVGYSWAGPGNFSSALQNPGVSVAGTYTLTVKNPVNGCTGSASVTVQQSIDKPNLTVTQPAALTCTNTSVSLTATSTTANTTITWSGFGTGQSPVSVNAPGKYYVTAVAANGCSTKDSVIVTQDINKPNLTIATPQVLTCNRTSVTLTASSSTANTMFTWTGKAAGQNPISVTAPGKYYVTATTANGCSTIDSVTVAQDVNKPNLTIATPQVLTCDRTSINLTASSGTPNTTFTWTGRSAGQNPISVTAPGKYYVTATTANGCSSLDSVTVAQDINKPNLTIAIPQVLTCNRTSVTLTASSTTANTTFTWTGKGIGQNPISVTAPGKYYVTATTSNGCSTIDSVIVAQDINKPSLTIPTPQVLTCDRTSINLTASSGTPNTTFTWTGRTAGQNPISVTAPGKYYVTATTANGCSTLDSVTVAQDINKPSLTIATPQVLTCDRTSINLTASSGTVNTTFTWTGKAAGQNPISVNAPGKYYVTATTANGCSTIDSVTVAQDINKPNLTIATPQVLTCERSSITLTASSGTANTTFTWTGRTAGQNPISVTAPGKYYVTATTANGCSTIDSVIVTQDINKPNLTIATPQVLTCDRTSITLTASSGTAGATFTWTGRTSGQNPISVTAPGKYYVTATTANGCSSLDSVTVAQDINRPSLTIATPQVLTCNRTSVTLTASSTTANTTFTWTGRTAGQNPISVTAPGKFYVTATTANGCSTLDSVIVTQDINKPSLTIATPQVLTCDRSSITLTASSTTANTTFTWTGKGTGQNPISVTAPGKYYVTATTANGCSTIDSVIVAQDINKPSLTIATPQVLTCDRTSITLTASSGTANTTFTWTGKTSGQNPISVTAPGKYYVTATTANGCSTIDSVTVAQDINRPSLTIATPQVLTCDRTSINLTASSGTANATFTWTGRTAGQNPISVTAPGKYYVTATTANGCSTIDSVIVTQDINKPNLTIATPQVLTCDRTSINLTASSGTANTTFTWTGKTAGQNPISVTAPGKYYVTATTANGCSSLDSVTVAQDINKPSLTITTPQILTCDLKSVNLTASSGTPNTTITWTGFATGQNPVSVNTYGKYYVTATSANGCFKKDSVTVIQNITLPADVQASNDGPLICTKTMVKITGNTTTGNVSYAWTGPNNFIATTKDANVNAKGTYSLKVTNNANGCYVTTSTTVDQNITPPANVQVSNDGPLTCENDIVTLQGRSDLGGATYQWTGPGINNESTATIFVTKPGTYTLSVTNPGNGCFVSTKTDVKEDKKLPDAVINAPASMPEPLSEDVITAKTVVNATYAWTLTSPDGSWQMIDGDKAATLIYQSGNAGVNGTFELIVTDRGNGCQNTARLTLTAIPATRTMALAAKALPVEYQTYPNPFVDKTFITFKSPVSGKVTVEIYNALQGHMEKLLFSQQVRSGETYKLTLDAGTLPAGVHFCVIKANGRTYTSKLLLVR